MKSIKEENTKIHFQGGTRSSYHFFELICRKQIRQNMFSEKGKRKKCGPQSVLVSESEKQHIRLIECKKVGQK